MSNLILLSVAERAQTDVQVPDVDAISDVGTTYLMLLGAIPNCARCTTVLSFFAEGGHN